jgi:CRISPR-associated endonuclease/helicase Cas3
VRAALRGTSFVYRDHLILWRSARVLAARGVVAVPEDVRGLVEAVYGPADDGDAPVAFDRNRIDATGLDNAARSLAHHNLLDLDLGYLRDGAPWMDEARVATRLGDPTVTLRLARRDGQGFRPWAEDPSPARAWALSEVTVRAGLVRDYALPADLAPAAELTRAGWGRYDQDKLLLPLTPAAPGRWATAGLEMLYSPERGLVPKDG